MNRLAVRGGRLLDPASGIDREADLFVADGVVLSVDSAPDGFEADETLDATGCLVAPGLIDLSAHLREPGATRKGGIVSEARAAAANGITTLVCPPSTNPVIDTPSVVELVRNRTEEASASHVAPLGALTRGLDGEHLAEMAALKEAGCPGMSDGGRPIRHTLVLRRALDYAANFGLAVVLTPEDPYLASSGRVHEGEVATRAGIPGQPTATETAEVGRVLALVEETGARVHFARLSSGRSAELIADARRRGLPVSADVAIHQLFLTEMDCVEYDTLTHVRPPLRTQSDRDRLRRAVADGDISVICSDHQPHDPDAKDCPFAESEPGISGLDTFLPLLLRLVDEGVLPLGEALRRVTQNAAEALSLTAGRLAPGDPADLVVIDPKALWTVSPEDFQSHGKNTPFTRWELQGRATHTVVS